MKCKIHPPQYGAILFIYHTFLLVDRPVLPVLYAPLAILDNALIDISVSCPRFDESGNFPVILALFLLSWWGFQMAMPKKKSFSIFSA